MKRLLTVALLGAILACTPPDSGEERVDAPDPDTTEVVAVSPTEEEVKEDSVTVESPVVEEDEDVSEGVLPEIIDVDQINIPFETFSRISSVVEVIYEGSCDVEVVEYDFEEDPNFDRANRSYLIPYDREFRLNDQGFAAFTIFEGQVESFSALAPVQEELRYLAREVCNGEPGQFGNSAVIQIRYKT